ncbi:MULTISPECIES: hypothetical protein [Nitrosospira]|nr:MULTISPECIES: hypothetical protein [Nitrosospira]
MSKYEKHASQRRGIMHNFSSLLHGILVASYQHTYTHVHEIMKIIVIALLVIASLVGCASKPPYEQTSTRLNDGTTRYFLKTDFKPCQSSRDWATRTLAKRANQICKSGYTLINEQTPVLLGALGESAAKRTLSWEIKCKTPEQSKS